MTYPHLARQMEIPTLDNYYYQQVANISPLPSANRLLEFYAGNGSSVYSNRIGVASGELEDDSLVSSWQDESETYTVLQATETNRPTYKLSVAALNNRSAVYYDGVDNFITQVIAGAIAGNTAINTVYIVIVPEANGTFRIYDEGNVGNTTPIYSVMYDATVGVQAQFRNDLGGASLRYLTDAETHESEAIIITFERNSGFSLRVNGIEVDSDTDPAGTLTINRLTLGLRAALPGDYIKGWLACVRVSNAADKATIEPLLGGHYGVALPPFSGMTITTSDSIMESLALMADGGTLTLRAGTYTEFVSVDSPITIKAYTGETVIIQAPAGAESASMEIDSVDVTLQDITIDATNRVRGIDVLAGADNFTMSGCTVQNCVGSVEGEYGQGVIVNSTNNGATFDNTTFDTIGGVLGDEIYCHGIYSACANLLVEYCNFANIDGNGVNVYGANTATYTIRNNEFDTCGGAVGVYRGVGIVHDNAGDNCDYGVIANFNPINAEVYNNAFTNAFIGYTSSNWSARVESVYFHDNSIDTASNSGVYSEHTGTLAEGQSVTFENTTITNCATAVSLSGDAVTEVTLINTPVV